MTFFYSVFYNSMTLAGGFFRIGAPQIKSFPIAIPDDETISVIEKKVDIIQEALNYENYDTAKNTENEIDQLVYSLYGITNDEVNIINGQY